MRRELRSVQTEQVLGAVDDRAQSPFIGSAGDVLGGLRREVGDARTVEIILSEGWSNGYLYFADPVVTL